MGVLNLNADVCGGAAGILMGLKATRTDRPLETCPSGPGAGPPCLKPLFTRDQGMVLRRRVLSIRHPLRGYPVQMNSFSEIEVLDLQRLETLGRLLGPSLRPVVVRFFEDCSKSLASLGLGTSQQDMALVRKIAHQMKGASSSIGLVQLQTWFDAVEKSAGANEYPSDKERAVANGLVDDARREFDRFCDHMSLRD